MEPKNGAWGPVTFTNCKDPLCADCGAASPTQKEMREASSKACDMLQEALEALELGAQPKHSSNQPAVAKNRERLKAIFSAAVKKCQSGIAFYCYCCRDDGEPEPTLMWVTDYLPKRIYVCVNPHGFCDERRPGRTDPSGTILHELTHFGNSKDITRIAKGDPEELIPADWMPGLVEDIIDGFEALLNAPIEQTR